MGEAPEKWIMVDTKKCELHLNEHEWTKKKYSIGIGKEDTPTPTGNYFIHSMCENPQAALRKVEGGVSLEAYGTRNISLSLMAFDFDAWCWRAYAIHGTNNDSGIGTRCSLGCIRMRNSDIEELYDLVECGTLVMIV